MEVRGELQEVKARWRKLAESSAELQAKAKQLDDAKPLDVIALIKQSAPLLRDVIAAADADLSDDADKLGVLTSLRDPDAHQALDSSGPHLRNTVLFGHLKGFAIRRSQVREVISNTERHLRILSRITLRILKVAEKAAEKQLRPTKKQTLVPSDAFADRYQNLKRIAEGVDGEVFSADDVALKRRVAIKFSRTSAPGHNNIIEHARALARVKHPNIVTVYDVCSVQDPTTKTSAQAVVMELVDGIPLTERIGKVVTSEDLARIGFAMLDAINAYHANGLAHMDLHDGNVVVGPNDVKLIDAVYRPTAAFASTGARLQQQGRDVRDVRDHLVQMLYHSTVPIPAAQRFERETKDPTIDMLRSKLREALDAS
jgi:tRNA A-37 threonylcarbamoyl transferase component Bud32